MVEKVDIAQKEITEKKLDSVEKEIENIDKTKELKKDKNEDNKENIITENSNDKDTGVLKNETNEDDVLNENKENNNELNDVDLKEKAQRHLAEGNKALLHGEATKALDELAAATNLFSQLYGDMDIQTAPSLYHYGCALLEVGRMETGVLTNAFDGVIDKMEGKEEDKECDKENEGEEKENEDDEKISEEIIDAMCEKSENDKDDLSEQPRETESKALKAEASTKGNEQSEIAKVESTENGNSKTNVENSEREKELQKQNEEESTKDNDDDVDEEEEEEEKDGSESEDVGNLQLAWEVVDLARSIYQKKVEELSSVGGDDLILNNKKLVDCHLKLGEIGVESETYDRALVEFLRVESLLSTDISVLPHDRRFAEVNYQLGLTSSFLNFYDKAIFYLQKSIDVLNQRIAHIESQMKDLPENDAEKELLQKELDEMKNLLPEINEKVKDINESRTYSDLKNLPQECSTSKNNDNKPADDISHLVRKKRKVDEVQSEDAQTKKPKVADTEVSETVG